MGAVAPVVRYDSFPSRPGGGTGEMGDEARKRARRREAKEAVIIAHDGAWAEGIEKETSIAVRLVGAIRYEQL